MAISRDPHGLPIVKPLGVTARGGEKPQDDKRGEKAVLRITSEGFCRRVVVLCDMYKCNKLKILGVLY